MIKNKIDYRRYLEQDRIALIGNRNGFLEYLKNDIWRFQRLLRKNEYWNNCKKGIISRGYRLILKYKLRKLSYILGYSIPINVFEEGLSIAHYGNIIINPNSKIGKNCRIHVGVNIGADARDGLKVPHIGDYVYIGPGAKIFGEVIIGNYTAIGANAVVNKSFPEGNVSIGGIPARIISNKGTEEIIKNREETSYVE